MPARLLVSLVALALAAPASALAADAGPTGVPPVAPRPPAAGQAQAHDDSSETVEAPVPTADPKATATPADAAAGTGSLPTTGFDVGRMAAVAMLMVGAGLLISAMAGPRPRRAAQLS